MEVQPPTDADRLFAGFVRTGDPRLLGEVYDLVAPELWPVALRTTRGPAEAEDVLQATFVAAIERAASFREGARVVPWLLGILANEARALRARERRAPDPARLEREADAGPDAEAERAELLAALDSALIRVPEAFRPVLQLKLRHGLTVTEIATALGRPAGTVRSQLARGSELLRRTLPASLAGALVAFVAPSRGLAAVRSAIVEQAAGLHGSLTLVTAAGGLLVMKKLVVLAVLLVAAVAWWSVGPRSSPSAPAPAPAEVAAAPVDPAPPAVVPPEAEAPPAVAAPEREHVPATAAAVVAAPEEPTASGAAVLVVTARRADGTPADGEIVLLTPPNGRNDDPRTGTTGADGSARFDELEPGMWWVRLLRGGERSLVLPRGRTTELALDVHAGVIVAGRVLDAGGEPVAGADIWLSERHRHNLGHVVARSDERGLFELRDIGPDHWLGARKRGFAPGWLRSVRGASGDRIALELRLDGAGVSLGGHVRDAAGLPIEGALVLAGEDPQLSVRAPDGAFVPSAPPQRARTDAEGRFELECVAPGALPLQARARGHAPLATVVEVLEHGRNEQDLVLLSEARVKGTVRDPSGKPLHSTWIHTERTELFASESTFSRLGGGFELAGLPAGRVKLVAEHAQHGRAERELVLVAGEAREWDIELAPVLGIRGRVVGPADEPRAGLIVLARDLADMEGRRVRSAETDADGAFELVNLEIAEHVVTVQPRGGWRAFPLLELAGVWPGNAPLDLRLPDESERGRVTALALGPDGAPLAGAELQLWHVELEQWRSFVSDGASGAIVAENVPPGTLDLELRHPQHPWRRIGARTVAAGETLDLGEIAFAASGRLRVRLARLPDELRESGPHAMLVRENRESGVLTWNAGELLSGPLLEGEHLLVLSADGSRQVRRTVRLDAGVETVLDVELEACAIREVVLTLPSGARPRWLAGSLIGGGELVWGGRADCNLDPPLARISAPPGTYHLVFGGEGGLKGETELVIGAPGTRSEPLVLPLLHTP